MFKINHPLDHQQVKDHYQPRGGLWTRYLKKFYMGYIQYFLKLWFRPEGPLALTSGTFGKEGLKIQVQQRHHHRVCTKHGECHWFGKH